MTIKGCSPLVINATTTPLQYAVALVAALTIQRRSGGDLVEHVAKALGIMLHGTVPVMSSWQTFEALSGVVARVRQRLTARAAAAASHLYMSREWRLEAVLSSFFRRCDLIHYIEFAQSDETQWKVRIRGDPLMASEVANFQPRRHSAILNTPSS